MPIYSKYMIKAGDVFNEYDYPKVMSELAGLREAVAHLPFAGRAEVIVSFLKGHSIKNILIDAHPKLVEIITSNTRSTAHLEGLFESCKQNEVFIKSYEEYVTKGLLSSTVAF